jgi:ATP-dependent Clp protease ATP-binding subunit ClpA
VIITLSDEALEWLTVKGYDPEMGARPLRRLIDEMINEPLADEILFGTLVDGGKVRVVVAAGDEELRKRKLELTYQPLSPVPVKAEAVAETN